MPADWAGIDRRQMTTRSRGLLPYQIVIGVGSGSIAGIVTVLGELRDELGFGGLSVGLIVSAGFLAAFVAQITLAQFADRGYARELAVIGIALSAASLGAMAVLDGVTGWTIARAGLGFGTGMVLPGVRRAATVLDPDRVGHNLGRLIVGEVVGFLFGPLLAAALASVWGFRTPFVVFALGMAAFVPFALRLPDDVGELDTSGRRSSFDLLGRRRLQGALLLVGGYFMLIGSFEAVIPVMFDDRGGGPMTLGIAFTLLGLPIVVVSPYAGRTADHLGPSRVATIGMTIVAASAAVYGVLPGLVAPIAVMAIVGVADGFGFTAAQVTVSRAVPEQRQAGALGLMGATEVLGAGLAATPAAFLYDRTGARLTWAVVSLVTLAVIALAHLRLRGTDPLHAEGSDVEWTPIDRHPTPGD